MSVKIMRNKATQISLGYGFLEFSSHDAANTVLATYNGKSMPGTNNVFRCAFEGVYVRRGKVGYQLGFLLFKLLGPRSLASWGS